MPSRSWLLVCVFFLTTCVRASFLVRVGDVWQVHKARAEPLGAPGAWQRPGYAASDWLKGVGGFSTVNGYFTEATHYEDYASDYTALYTRKSFQVPDTNAVRWLTLRIDYNDAFVAYLNGVEAARRNLPQGPVTFSTVALSPHLRGVPEEIDLSPMKTNLLTGENVLAVQVHGQGPPLDYDFSLTAELLMNFTRGPVLQNASSNQIQVIWKTPFPATSLVQYGTTPSLAQSVTNLDLVNTHAILLTGLQPDTTYYYRAISTLARETVASPVETFRTLKPQGSFSFVVSGDLGQGTTFQYNVASIMQGLQPDFALLVGDIIYPAFTAALAEIRHFSIYEPQMKNVPFFYAPGNHDSYFNTTDFYDTLYMPTNKVTGTEHFYSFDHGDGHFVVLNTDMQAAAQYEVGSPQYQWLENDLAATARPWKFLFFHHAMRTSSSHLVDDYDANGERDMAQLQRTIGVLAAKYGVSIAFQGHDHVYERFNPIAGTYSITTGGGGAALYHLVLPHPDSSQFFDINHCVRVQVQGEKLFLQAFDINGQVFDTMTLYQKAPTNAFSAVWHTPLIESGPADDADGNVTGQRFDFSTNAIPSVGGKYSNLGQAYVANIRTWDRPMSRTTAATFTSVSNN